MAECLEVTNLDKNALATPSRSRSVVKRDYILKKDNYIPSEDNLETPKSSESGVVYTFLVSDQRLDAWIKALKIRYWLDFGATDTYRVEWIDVKDASGLKIVEHIVKVFSTDADETEINLYTITVYLTKRKIMVQGNFRDLWVDQEFKFLAPLVTGLLQGDKLASDVYHELTGSKLSFTVDNLILSDSDDVEAPVLDEDIRDPKDQSQVPENGSVNSVYDFDSDDNRSIDSSFLRGVKKRRSHEGPRSSKKKSKQAKGHKQRKGYKLIESTCIQTEVRDLDERITACENSIRAYEINSVQFTLTQDKQESTADKLQDIKAEIDSFKTSVLRDVSEFKDNVNKQVTNISVSQRDAMSELETVKNELITENKKLASRFTSVSDRLANYEQKFKMFEKESQGKLNERDMKISELTKKCEALKLDLVDIKNKQSRLESLHSYATVSTSPVNEGHERGHEAQDSRIPTVFANTDRVNGHGRDQLNSHNWGDKPWERPSSQAQKAKETQPSAVYNERDYGYDKYFAQRDSPVNKYACDVVVLMDSNRKFVDPGRMFPNKSVNIVTCGNLNSAKKIIEEPRFSDPQTLIIHTGVNDIEEQNITPNDVALKFEEVVARAKSKFPKSQVVISEITPRMDEHAEAVHQVNAKVRVALSGSTNVSLINHDNLDDERCFYDRKHLSRSVGVPQLVKNIKGAVYGARPKQGGLQHYFRHTHQQRWGYTSRRVPSDRAYRRPESMDTNLIQRRETMINSEGNSVGNFRSGSNSNERFRGQNIMQTIAEQMQITNNMLAGLMAGQRQVAV